MSGGVPKKVWQGKMRTKTNQTGMKLQGIPSLIGRKALNKRYVETRVNSRMVLCGAGIGGWRCRYGVNGAAAGALARRNYCHQVQNGVNGVVCNVPQPITRNLAGGVGHKLDNVRLGQVQSNNNNIIHHCKKC
jgi:hypothetical protein